MVDSTPRLTYSPSVDFDRLNLTNEKDLKAINPTLAISTFPGEHILYFHANSLVTPWHGARDVSHQYRILRLRRQWEGKLTGSPPQPIVDKYELAKRGTLREFFDDHGHVDKSWNDCPGARPNAPKKEGYRDLQEFVTGVGQRSGPKVPLPEFGGLYYIVAVDVTPKKYRLWISLERRLTGDQVQGAMGVPGKPYPGDLIKVGPPEFAEWRFVPHDWTDYTWPR